METGRLRLPAGLEMGLSGRGAAVEWSEGTERAHLEESSHVVSSSQVSAGAAEGSSSCSSANNATRRSGGAAVSGV